MQKLINAVRHQKWGLFMAGFLTLAYHYGGHPTLSFYLAISLVVVFMVTDAIKQSALDDLMDLHTAMNAEHRQVLDEWGKTMALLDEARRTLKDERTRRPPINALLGAGRQHDA